MDERTLILTIMAVLSAGALMCFAGALYFWVAQRGHFALAPRLEARMRGRCEDRASTPAPALARDPDDD